MRQPMNNNYKHADNSNLLNDINKNITPFNQNELPFRMNNKKIFNTHLYNVYNNNSNTF